MNYPNGVYFRKPLATVPEVTSPNSKEPVPVSEVEIIISDEPVVLETFKWTFKGLLVPIPTLPTVLSITK